MADIQHSAITDPHIHEPKGASTASVDTVWVADGAGSGAFQKIEGDQFDETSVETFIQNALDDNSVDVTGRFYLTAVIEDVSTASSILIPVIRDCTVIGARLTLGGAIATADATVSFVDASAASLGTSVTVAFTGSAEGTGFDFTASTNQNLTGPTYIKVSTDGASDNAVPLYITVEFEQVLNV